MGKDYISKFELGFTGHEHLPEFGLINMNGRLYDPVLGRFLSPDNYVQAADLTQSFNRYSYALNNPLMFTDPSGEKWKWKWLSPFHWISEGMQWINDNTEDLRDAMFDANIPAFGGGYNSANGTFHYVGNSGNIYHNPPGDNASAAVYGAINNARAEYYAYHNWEPAGLDNILNQQFVGTSPLANNIADSNSKTEILARGFTDDYTLAIGPGGFAIEIGSITYKGENYNITTVGYAVGWDISAGLNYITIKGDPETFRISDLGGWSSQKNASVWYGSGGYEIPYRRDYEPTNLNSYRSISTGPSIGTNFLGGSYVNGFTWIWKQPKAPSLTDIYLSGYGIH